MTNQSTIDKLIEMRLTTMADAYVTLDSTSRKQMSWISTTLPGASLTRILLTGLQFANIYLNTGIYLLPVQQAAVKLTCLCLWHGGL